MNLNPYGQLVWKEYRAVRAFWLSIVVLVVLLEWLIAAVYSSPASLVLLYSFGLAAPAFFAIGATGAAFAMEQEEGTFEFLRAGPATPRQVLASKLAVACVATLAMLGVLWPSTLLFTYPKSPDALNGMLGLWLMAAVEAIVWGTLFSLLTARPLVAICLALAVASTITHLLAWSVATGRIYEFEFAPYLAALPRRALVVAVVLAADIYLGLRWLDVGTREKVKLTIGRRKTKRIDLGARTESSSVKGLLVKPDRGAMLAHLLWHQWRQSAWLMALLAGLHVALTLLMLFSGISLNPRDSGLVMVPMALVAALMGCCVFLPDQERRGYRFFVEHNIPPRYVWLSRQLPWIVTLFVSTLAICLFWVPLDSIASLWQIVKSATDSWPGYQWQGQQQYGYFHDFVPYVELPPIVIGLVWVSVSYAAGQWASMFVRSGIMAVFFGLLLGGVLGGWVALMYAMQVSFLWSVAPIPLVLLWATWLRAPDWAAENTRWTARGRAAAAVLIPALALVIAVPIYRVRQVPPYSPGFDPAEYLSEIRPEGRETAALYRRADELYVKAELYSRQLEENGASLALVLEASQRPTCTFDDPATLTDWPRLRNAYALIQLVVASGRQLEVEGKLDEALDRYFAALRIASHWANCPWRSDSTSPTWIAVDVFSKLANWAAQKGQTGERIHAAIKQLQAVDSSVLRLDDRLKADYIVARRAVSGDIGAWSALTNQPKVDSQIMQRILWGKLMPWEKRRGLRMLNLLTQTALDRLRNMRDALARGQGVVDFLSPTRNWNSIHDFSATNDYYFHGRDPVAHQKAMLLATTYTTPEIGFSGTFAAAELAELESRRRATLLLLALEAHRLEHGELPQSLAELVGPYFDVLPLDPYSGQEFRYFPAGLPLPESPLETAELNARRSWPFMHPPIYDVVPGKPCIWCTGTSLRADTWTLGESPDEPRENREQAKQAVYYTYRENSYSLAPLPPNVAWRQGYWFPIPGAPLNFPATP